MTNPTDEEIMELMPQQLRDDLSHAARAARRPKPPTLKAQAQADDFRALCAELIDAYEHELNKRGMGCDLINRARALLDQPVAEEPTDEELWAAGSDDFRANYYPTDAIAYASAVLAKWAHQ